MRIHEFLDIVHDYARLFHARFIGPFIGHDDDMRDLESLDHGVVLARAKNAILELLEDSIEIRLSILVLAGYQIEYDNRLILVCVSNI